MLNHNRPRTTPTPAAGPTPAAAMAALTDDQMEKRLTPTQDLLMEVLGARSRLGEHLWTFDGRHEKALDGLADHGLVHVMNGATERTVRASFTDAGKARWTSSTYVSPLEREMRVLRSDLAAAEQEISDARALRREARS